MSAVSVQEPELQQGYQDTRIYRFEQNVPIPVLFFNSLFKLYTVIINNDSFISLI